MKNVAIFAGLLIAATLTGCVSPIKYPPSADWGKGTRILGPVKANSGFWSLSLRDTPSEYTFTAALRDKAAAEYNVPPESVVLGEKTVYIGAELDGTIRDWRAEALAGQNTNTPAK